MAELLDRIPDAQDIFGLLRLWSPVWLTGEHEGYRSAVANLDVLTIAGPDGQEEQKSVALDLTDPTGRAQAAAWADKATTYDTVEFIQRLKAGMLPSLDERHAVDLGMRFADMTPEQIDTLARLCLRLAGRS